MSYCTFQIPSVFLSLAPIFQLQAWYKYTNDDDDNNNNNSNNNDNNNDDDNSNNSNNEIQLSCAVQSTRIYNARNANFAVY